MESRERATQTQGHELGGPRVPRRWVTAAGTGSSRGDGQEGSALGYFLRSSQQDLLMDRLWGLRPAEGVAQAPGFLDPSKVLSTQGSRLRPLWTGTTTAALPTPGVSQHPRRTLPGLPQPCVSLCNFFCGVGWGEGSSIFFLI